MSNPSLAEQYPVRRIAVVTGSRADYGILYWVIKEIQEKPELQLILLATGMHLSPEFGLTYRQIEEDGFPITEKVEILMSADSETSISTSIGLGVAGFAAAFARNRPDILVLLGDRFESLSAAVAAMVARIPIGHISGGQTTEGAIDEAIRHSITKMSHLHFTHMPVYRDRIVQMGEHPDRVYITGTPSLDGIRRLQMQDRGALEETLGLDLGQPFFLVVYHPVTLEEMSAAWQTDELLKTLSDFDQPSILIMPNSDTGGRIIFEKIHRYVEDHDGSKAFVNLNRSTYLNLLAKSEVLVGNSSSGIIEAPSLGIPVVNIGDRQRGRVRVGNVIDCEPDAGSIKIAITAAVDTEFKKSLQGLTNPYGDGFASKRIVDVLGAASLGESLLKKKFYDFNLNDPKPVSLEDEDEFDR